jgi:predicted nucleic acid-binding protein
MTFDDLVAGDQVFVDANVLAYHFQPHPRWGTAYTYLVQRIYNQELTGFTSTHVLAEASHRLMTLEANTLLGWPVPGIGNRLRTNPAEVQKLALFRRAVEGIVQSSTIQILIVTPPLLATAAALCQQLGLLTNDGLIVAIMQAHGLTKLASNDTDFDRVPGLTRYAPA